MMHPPGIFASDSSVFQKKAGTVTSTVPTNHAPSPVINVQPADVDAGIFPKAQPLASDSSSSVQVQP